MERFEIRFTGDASIKELHHISVDFDGYNFSVIFGHYINGGFCCIPNWAAGCELSADLTDVCWNASAIGTALKKKRAGRAIAEAISIYVRMVEEKHGDQK